MITLLLVWVFGSIALALGTGRVLAACGRGER